MNKGNLQDSAQPPLKPSWLVNRAVANCFLTLLPNQWEQWSTGLWVVQAVAPPPHPAAKYPVGSQWSKKSCRGVWLAVKWSSSICVNVATFWLKMVTFKTYAVKRNEWQIQLLLKLQTFGEFWTRWTLISPVTVLSHQGLEPWAPHLWPWCGGVAFWGGGAGQVAAFCNKDADAEQPVCNIH